MWESRRDFQEEWEGWKTGFMVFHAFHSSAFPMLAVYCEVDAECDQLRTTAFTATYVWLDNEPMKLSLRATVLCAAWVLQPIRLQGQKPPEIPSRMQAWSRAADWQTPRRTFLSVESRRTADPANAGVIEKDYARALQTLRGMAFPVVADRNKADLEVSLIVDPHVRYGMFHYQNAPYVYLLVRERASDQLGYCAYRRLSRISDQTSALLAEWREATVRRDASPSGSLEECAAQAMRPVHSNKVHRDLRSQMPELPSPSIHHRVYSAITAEKDVYQD
jgi:hypothetical protein